MSTTSSSVTISQGTHPTALTLCVNVPIEDWQALTHQRDSLLRENADLKANIDLLRGESDRLRQENKHQTIVIEKLQLTIIELQKENEQLKRQNQELKDELVDVRSDLADVKAELTIMKNEAMFKKIITAIQDINAEDQLETSYRYLGRLRTHRVDNAHYIQHTDSADVQAYKRSLLRDRLRDAKNNRYIANKLTRYSPSLIQDLDNHLNQSASISQLSVTDKEDAEEWWKW